LIYKLACQSKHLIIKIIIHTHDSKENKKGPGDQPEPSVVWGELELTIFHFTNLSPRTYKNLYSSGFQRASTEKSRQDKYRK
jgi:hypothetical protein